MWTGYAAARCAQPCGPFMPARLAPTLVVCAFSCNLLSTHQFDKGSETMVRGPCRQLHLVMLQVALNWRNIEEVT